MAELGNQLHPGTAKGLMGDGMWALLLSRASLPILHPTISEPIANDIPTTEGSMTKDPPSVAKRLIAKGSPVAKGSIPKHPHHC